MALNLVNYDFDEDENEDVSSKPIIKENSSSSQKSILITNKHQLSKEKDSDKPESIIKKISYLNLPETKKLIDTQKQANISGAAKDDWIPRKLDEIKEKQKITEKSDEKNLLFGEKDFENPVAKKFLSVLPKIKGHYSKQRSHQNDMNYSNPQMKDPYLSKKIKTDTHEDFNQAEFREHEITNQDKELIRTYDKNENFGNISDSRFQEVNVEDLLDVNWKIVRDIKRQEGITDSNMSNYEPSKLQKKKNQLTSLAFDAVNANNINTERIQNELLKDKKASKYGW